MTTGVTGPGTGIETATATVTATATARGTATVTARGTENATATANETGGLKGDGLALRTTGYLAAEMVMLMPTHPAEATGIASARIVTLDVTGA